MCAIKLLNDPDLAPTKLRKDFLKLAEGSAHTFSEVPAIIFKDGTEVDVWLERIHGGPQGGIGGNNGMQSKKPDIWVIVKMHLRSQSSTTPNKVDIFLQKNVREN